MRREDKRRVPPRLKARLPAGYHLEAVPDGYMLYHSYPFGAGRMTELVCGFTPDSTREEIEAVARAPRLGG